MVSFLSISLFLLIFNSQSISTVKIDFHFERFDMLKSSYAEVLCNITKIQITRANSSTYVLNWDADFGYEIDEDVMVEYGFYFNQNNSHQYVNSNVQLPKSSVCEAFNEYGPMLVTSSMKSVTNLPVPGKGKYICPIPKVK